MGAFQAIRDAEQADRDAFFAIAKDPTAMPNTGYDSIKESYRKGEYSGGEDRPAYNSRGRKKIQGYKASQRFKENQERQDERDKFFEEAGSKRYLNAKGKSAGEMEQMRKSYDRGIASKAKRKARQEADRTFPFTIPSANT